VCEILKTEKDRYVLLAAWNTIGKIVLESELNKNLESNGACPSSLVLVRKTLSLEAKTESSTLRPSMFFLN